MIGAERLILIGCLLQGTFTGDLQRKNCTTLLENLPKHAHDKYYLRLHEPIKWSYKETFLELNITDSPPKPKLTTEKVEVMEGTSVSLSCSAAAPCPKLPPNLTWTPRLSDSVDQLQENEDKTTSVSSVLTFTASHLHHGQKITCRALYTLQQGGNQKMSEASLTLKVRYPPKNTSVGSEQYYCEAQNKHGKENSTTVLLNVIYMPQISGSGSCSRTAAEISCSWRHGHSPLPQYQRSRHLQPPALCPVSTATLRFQHSLTADWCSCWCRCHDVYLPHNAACSKMATQDEESANANKTTLSDPGAVGKGNGTSLHYATVDFSKLRSTGGNQGTGVIRGTSQRTSDYAVIRHRSREEGEEVQGEVEVEKEGPAELGAERETAEVRGGQEGEPEGECSPNVNQQPSINPDPVEEATYGNICRSRPTKRAQQGQQETPRNPAPEEEEQREEGQEDMYVDLMSPLTEGGGKGVEESEYAEVRKLQ
ncbi:hypothetical protein COCON_G00234150 [Conger conger]|uniref:Ig-like domain-containing protein n=1 Tax=Conger conger TaxID=82655 RepID=A0A9Q1CUT4_CONCO|nr:hypothetical protein COCON_G00234150 [Conger conger]